MECKKCLLTDDILGVTLDKNGVCNFCELHDQLDQQYPVSYSNLEKTFDRIRDRGKGHKYDCLVGISGGIDSTYMLLLCWMHGVKAFAFHFDNGFNTEQAEHNMAAILKYTGFNHDRYTINPETWRNVNLAVLSSAVSDADIPNDIAMAKLMLDKAHEMDCPTILNGHSFRNEGSVPIGWTYMDGAYLRDMYRRYWGERIPKDFPILSVWDQVKASLRGIKHERPLYYSGLTKDEQVGKIMDYIDFETYGGHHAENEYTSFAGWSIYHRYRIDKRVIVLSAWIRNGKITKRDAKINMSQYPYSSILPPFAIEVRARLKPSTFTWINIMGSERKMFYDFKTYQKTFRRWRWLIKLAVKAGFLPETFSKKYTQKIDVK